MALIFTPGQLNQRADFYFQLRSLVVAGIPLIQAFEMLGANPPSRSYRLPVARVVKRLEQGATLVEAMGAERGWLPEFDLSLIAAGEQSGRIESVLQHLGEYYKERAALTRQVLSALAYPFFVIHLFILVFPPGYLPLLVWQGEVALFLTQKLSVLIPLYLILLVMLLAGQGSRGRRWRAFMERILNAVPLLGRARKDLALARLTSALGALLSAGVDIVTGWQLAARASGSGVLGAAVGRMVPRIQAGVTPAEALRENRAFPEVFRNLYSSGEISGQLDSTLVRLQSYYQEQAAHKFQNFSQWFPRVILLIVAAAVGYTVIKFYVGYFGGLLDTPI